MSKQDATITPAIHVHPALSIPSAYHDHWLTVGQLHDVTFVFPHRWMNFHRNLLINWKAWLVSYPVLIGVNIITPHVCTRGKAIVFVCHLSSVVGTKIARSQYLGMHLSDSQAQWIHQNWRKTGFAVLRIVWHSPWTSQIVCLLATPIDHTYSKPCASAHAHHC